MQRLFLLLVFFVTAANAEEGQILLKEGKGKDKVEANCSMCHSLDYIITNASVMDKTGWEKTVNKMIKVMGAPIDDSNKKIIIDYLTNYYGKNPCTNKTCPPIKTQSTSSLLEQLQHRAISSNSKMPILSSAIMH